MATTGIRLPRHTTSSATPSPTTKSPPSSIPHRSYSGDGVQHHRAGRNKPTRFHSPTSTSAVTSAGNNISSEAAAAHTPEQLQHQATNLTVPGYGTIQVVDPFKKRDRLRDSIMAAAETAAASSSMQSTFSRRGNPTLGAADAAPLRSRSQTMPQGLAPPPAPMTSPIPPKKSAPDLKKSRMLAAAVDIPTISVSQNSQYAAEELPDAFIKRDKLRNSILDKSRGTRDAVESDVALALQRRAEERLMALPRLGPPASRLSLAASQLPQWHQQQMRRQASSTPPPSNPHPATIPRPSLPAAHSHITSPTAETSSIRSQETPPPVPPKSPSLTAFTIGAADPFAKRDKIRNSVIDTTPNSPQNQSNGFIPVALETVVDPFAKKDLIRSSTEEFRAPYQQRPELSPSPMVTPVKSSKSTASDTRRAAPHTDPGTNRRPFLHRVQKSVPSLDMSEEQKDRLRRTRLTRRSFEADDAWPAQHSDGTRVSPLATIPYDEIVIPTVYKRLKETEGVGWQRNAIDPEVEQKLDLTEEFYTIQRKGTLRKKPNDRIKPTDNSAFTFYDSSKDYTGPGPTAAADLSSPRNSMAMRDHPYGTQSPTRPPRRDLEAPIVNGHPAFAASMLPFGRPPERDDISYHCASSSMQSGTEMTTFGASDVHGIPCRPANPAPKPSAMEEMVEMEEEQVLTRKGACCVIL